MGALQMVPSRHDSMYPMQREQISRALNPKIEGGLCLCTHQIFLRRTLSAPLLFQVSYLRFYLLPFIDTPHICFLINKCFAFCNKSFVESAFLQFFDQGFIKEETSTLYFANPFTVAVGKKLS